MVEYGFNFKGKAFVPSGGNAPTESKSDTDARNKAISDAEVAAFVEEKPEKYFLYIKQSAEPHLGGDFTWSKGQGEATTWTGDKLGVVEFGREYKVPGFGFPSVRVPITVHAINGCTYHGTYFKSSGDYARVKKSKAKGK